MLRIAVCEDLVQDAKRMERLLRHAMESYPFPAVIQIFSCGEDFLAALESGEKFDLCLLDVFLGGIDGVQAARRATALRPDLLVAFITTSRDFAAEAFDLDAVYYLIKPVTEENLSTLLQRYFRRRGKPSPTLNIQTSARLYAFPLRQVLKIQSSNKGVEIYLQGQLEPQRIPLPLVRVEEQLDPNLFLKISRGLIVPMNAIVRMDKETCFLKDGSSALLSRRERKEIHRRYNDFLFRSL